MDKLNLFKLEKENNTNQKNNHINNKLYTKETHTPNKIPPIKTRTHIKIKSRDLNRELNLNTENNITYNYHKLHLRPNKTLNNLNTLKINRDKKLKINLINRHHLSFSYKKNDTYKKILNLWKDLGVNYIYQSVFNKTIKDLRDKERDDYLKYEFDKLNNIFNIIKLIKNDIKNRENIIYQLQSNYNNKNIQNKNFDEETIKQIISIFNDIRKYSLDITYNILLLKKEIGFDLSLNKFDINKIFSFKKDYIIKINSDLDFLSDSSLNQYFSFEKSDPFFANIKFNINYSYNFPEIKDEKKNYILKNFKNIFFDELIGQNLNLNNGKNNNLESIINFKHFKFNKIASQNNIIKAQRGLSKQKLRPKINNKIYIEANSKSISDKTKTEIINAKNIQNIRKKVFNTNINLNFNSKIKEDNLPQFDEDMKIFEKIIEQKIFGKEKKFDIINENKKNKSYNKKSSKFSTDKKKELSNFIQNIFDETEIELSEKTNPKKLMTNNNGVGGGDNTEIINDNKIKKIYDEFYIELYKDKLSEIEKIYQDYYKHIPEKIKYGFNIQSNIVKYINGIYPKILLVKSNQKNNTIIGIITLNYISANTNSISIAKVKSNNYNKILNISSISCLDENQFESILLNTIDFCQEFFYFENIILELYYLNKEGQFILYTDLENIIKSKAKFRWVNMENDGINRKIKYKLVNKNIKNNNDENIINNIINLKCVNLIGYEEEKNYKKRDIRELAFINDFSINYLLLEMKGQQNFKITDNKNNGNNYINNLTNKVTFKSINRECSDFLISQIGANNDIEKFIDENKNVFNVSDFLEKINKKIYYEPYFSISILNINNSFKNIVKKKFNGYIYNILLFAQISEFSIKDKNDNELIFYLIKNPEYNSSMIIYQLTEKQTFADMINIFSNNNDNNNKKNISEIFKDIFSLVNQKPMKVNKNICIPCFKCQANQMCFRPSVFSDVILENDSLDKKYKINFINFIEELTFGIDEPNIIKENIMDLDNFINKDDIIIKNDFIINFVENNLIFELQIPTIATFFVEKKNWIKSD